MRVPASGRTVPAGAQKWFDFANNSRSDLALNLLDVFTELLRNRLFHTSPDLVQVRHCETQVQAGL
jgi:hypothetical protein